MGHTSADADIDGDAAVAAGDAEVLAVQVDVVLHTASAWEAAASTGLGGSCTEVAAEAFAHSPRWVTLTWHVTAAAHSSEQSRQGSLDRSRCGTSAWVVEAYSQNDGPAFDDAYAAEAWVAVAPVRIHHSKQEKAIGIPDA